MWTAHEAQLAEEQLLHATKVPSHDLLTRGEATSMMSAIPNTASMLMGAKVKPDV